LNKSFFSPQVLQRIFDKISELNVQLLTGLDRWCSEPVFISGSVRAVNKAARRQPFAKKLTNVSEECILLKLKSNCNQLHI